jgi:hypothetical protein
MYTCPKCKGFAYGEDHTDCTVCMMNGVVLTLYKPCPNCNGNKCYQCKQKGYIIQPEPFVLPSRRIPMEDIRNAFTLSRIGHTGEDTLEIPYKRKRNILVDPFAYGAIPVLLEISEERGGPSTEPGEWFQRTIMDGDALVIDPSGIWLEKNGFGIRIFCYDLEES